MSKKRCQSNIFLLTSTSMFQTGRKHRGFPYPDQVLSENFAYTISSAKLLQVFQHEEKLCPVHLVNPVSSSLKTWFACVTDFKEAFVP